MTLKSDLNEIKRVILDVPSTENQHCTLAIDADENTAYVRLLITFYGNTGGTIFMDNIEILESNIE